MSERDGESRLSGPAPAPGLRAYTPARVGLGRTGVSQQWRDVLAFQLAHARARDAVHIPMNAGAVEACVASIVEPALGVATFRLRSAAPDRAAYLQRPDLGRRLDEKARQAFADCKYTRCDLSLVIADGLSALAVERHVAPLLREWLPRLAHWSSAPVFIVEQGRVAIGDEIGAGVRADISVVLIGERPGLSSPDSLGAYITWQPRESRTDAERNCISNIRAEGLSYRDASDQLMNCVLAARLNGFTGTALGQAKNRLEDGSRTGEK